MLAILDALSELGYHTESATHSDGDVPTSDLEEDLVLVYNDPTYLGLG